MGLFGKMKDLQQQAAAATAGMAQQAHNSGGSMGAGDMFAARDALQEQGNEYHRLMAAGTPGTATIVSSAPTGEVIAGNTVLTLELQVTPQGGTPYPTSLRFIAAGGATAPYEAGTTYNARIDPADPSKLTFCQ